MNIEITSTGAWSSGWLNVTAHGRSLTRKPLTVLLPILPALADGWIEGGFAALPFEAHAHTVVGCIANGNASRRRA